MSGSEVSTHPKAVVQKTKRFFSQLKNVEKKVFWKINKFCILVRENCSARKSPCSKRHIEWFPASQSWIFDVRLPKLRYATMVKSQNIKKSQKTVFIGPSEKLKAFRFFLQFSKYFALPSFHYTACGRFFSQHSKNQFRSPTAKVGICDYKEKSTYPKIAKIGFYKVFRKVENFPIFFTVFWP